MSKKIENSSEVVVLTEDMWKADFTPTAYDHCKTKSSEIRARFANGESKASIAKSMNIRYQHVRNVLLNPPKK